MTTETLVVRPAGYVPPPLRDEPLDGYLEHLTHRLGLRPGVIRAHFGLTDRGTYGSAQGLPDAEAAHVATITGWSIDQVHAMTLRQYARVGLMPIVGVTGGGPGPWLRRNGARFCPACLRERQGRWRLSWYLQWTYVCLDHATLLHVACPACGRPPRTRRGGHPPVGPPATPDRAQEPCVCAVATLAAADQRCGGAETILEQRVPEPFLRAQQTITDRITVAHRVHYMGLERPSIEWVHDLAALTRLIAVNAPHDHLPNDYAAVIGALENESVAESAVEAIRGVKRPRFSAGPIRGAALG